MKQDITCSTLCMSPGVPCLPWRAEDAARILRMIVKPALVAVAIALLAATLLLGGRSLAPFVIVGGIGNSAHFAMTSERAAEERELQAEVDRLLASFEPSTFVKPSSTNELP